MLAALAFLNTFLVDSDARPRIVSNFNKAIMEAVPAVAIEPTLRPLLVHGALLLSCVTREFEPLLDDQLGGVWRTRGHKGAWPLLGGDDERWRLRAAIDAAVAHAYGVDDATYGRILSTFPHRSYPQAASLCLAAFDEVTKSGLDAFVRKHDPYWDIPLVTTLPRPAIDLPGADPATSGTFHLEPAEAKSKRGRTKRGGTT